MDTSGHELALAQAEAMIERQADELRRLRGENEALASNLRGKHATTGATYAHLVAERDRMRDGNAGLRAELSACAAALPGPIYMDPPDGGSVTVAEQLARMAKDAARYRWLRTEASASDWEMFGYHDVSMTDAAIDAAMEGK